MCVFTAGIVNAHTLHVENKTFALSQTKYTTPSLAFGVGNEVWYAPLARVFINDSLHLRVGSTTYSVINCAEGFVDTENYTYDENGRLIGADENLWAQNKSYAYIDTGFTANGNTRIKTKFYNTSSGAKWFFGSRMAKNYRAFALQCPGNNYSVRNDYGNLVPNITGTNCGAIGIFVVDKNKGNTTLIAPNGLTYTNNNSTTNFTISKTTTIFGANTEAGVQTNTNKFYYFKIYSDGADENTLVRDMVPVPACMRIGDFIVPENGMWDIVEQKFYGNANATGTIIYGKDK